MTTSAGLSCEAFENAMVCEMQPKCSERRLRCGDAAADDDVHVVTRICGSRQKSSDTAPEDVSSRSEN